MPTILATLGLFRIGTTDYSAGQARTIGSYHLVRKQYGDNSAIFNYARFLGSTAEADFLAACHDPSLATWVPYPYSEYDYTLLILPLSSPLPASTTTAGATTASGGTADVTPVVQKLTDMMALLPTRNADGTMQLHNTADAPLQVEVKRATTPPTLALNAATETTVAAVLAQLKMKLIVGVDGAVTVSGPATDAQLRAAPLPVAVSFPATQPVSLATVPLATGAATAANQAGGNGLLADIKGQLAAPLTFTLPTGAATAAAQADQLAKLETLRQLLASVLTVALPTGASTSALQAVANGLLNDLKTALASQATAAGQTALAGKQDTANGYLQTLATTGIATTAGPATPFSLVTVQGSNATLVATAGAKLLGGTVSNTATAYRYLFLYNLAAAPAANGTLPTTAAAGLVRTVAVPPNSSVSLNLAAGRYTAFPLGLVIAAAAGSTLSTVTSAAAGLTAGIGLTAGELVINLDTTA